MMKRTNIAALLLAITFSLAHAVQVLAIPDEQFYAGNDVIYYDPDWKDCVPGAAGGGGADANINVDKGFSLGKTAGERQANFARALMKDYGLTAEQAAGVVGNIMREAGPDLFPDYNERLGIAGDGKGPPRPVIPGVNTGGYGWAQWTGPRKTSFVEFAVKNGYVESANVNFNDAANYAYLKYELSTGYKGTIPDLKKTTTIDQATISFENTFEKAGVPAISERIANAKKVLASLSGGGGGGDVSTSPSSGSGGCPSSGAGSGDIVAIALGELGNQEEPVGCDQGNPSTPGNCGADVNKYTDSTLEYWCADFVSWVYKQAGKPFTGGSSGGWRIAGVDAVEAWFRARGPDNYFSNGSNADPQPGDVYFIGTESNGVHIGIVEKVEGGDLYTISGNTSIENFSNGMGVGKLTYKDFKNDSRVVGFGRY